MPSPMSRTEQQEPHPLPHSPVQISSVLVHKGLVHTLDPPHIILRKPMPISFKRSEQEDQEHMAHPSKHTKWPHAEACLCQLQLSTPTSYESWD
jgi:hypothetical protein